MSEQSDQIVVKDLYKIFGPDPESVLPLVEQGKSKSEIQAETGHILGVNKASFSLKPGEVFCIMGLSGSGKSTLIRCINRLIEPTAGKIFFHDADLGESDITAMSEEQLRKLRRHSMSMVFQHFALFPHRSVLSNVIYGLEIQGRDTEQSREKGREVLRMVGLGDWADSPPSSLSGGMQQRVGLARALATDAKVLLMDEPFSALDPLIKVNMQEELKRIQQELHRTVLFITHDLDEAMRIGDHIAIMDDGAIVQIGSPEDILVNPRTEYVANFVEHADPTSVITAGTIALPLNSAAMVRAGESEGITYYHRRTTPELRIGVDAEGRLQRVTVSDEPASIEAFEQLDSAMDWTRRRADLLLTCEESMVLRRLLLARSLSTLPLVVHDEQGRVQGIVGEPELIQGILEKRAYTETAEDTAAAQPRGEAV